MRSDTGSSGEMAANAGRTSRYRTVSEATVTLTARMGNLGEPWFGRFWLQGNHVYRAFETAPKGTFESHVEHVLVGQVVERVSIDGGQLSLAHNEELNASLAVWSGTAHEIYTWLHGPLPDASQLTEIFEDLEIEDFEEGVRATPRLPTRTSLHDIELKKYIPDIGFLTILDGAQAVDLLPKWSGARAAYGEVWAKAPDGLASKGAYLVHASESAVTLAVPEPKPGVNPQAMLDFIADLQVSWTDGQVPA